jgi:hypothetical protein
MRKGWQQGLGFGAARATSWGMEQGLELWFLTRHMKCVYAGCKVDVLRLDTTTSSNRVQIIIKVWNMFEQLFYLNKI